MSSSKGSTAIVCSVIFTVFAACCVSARLVARVIILRNVGPDEVTITISLLTSIAFTVLIGEQVQYGLGRHFSTVSSNDLEQVLKFLWASILFYNISLTLTKTSIVLQYLRVFVGTRIRIACWSTIGFIIIYGIWTVISDVFSCVPVSAFWDESIHGRCISHKFLWFFNAAVNILTDLIILVLPMPALSTLRLPLRQKIVLMFIFALGGFVCLVSILRLHSLYIVSVSKDITWDNTEAALWSSIEVNTGIVCASLPTIKPIISWLFPRLLSSTRSNQGMAPSHNIASGSHSTSRFRPSGIGLTDFAPVPKTVTRVEASDSTDTVGEGGMSRTVDGRGKDIHVTTYMTQDVEGRSEMGSEKDLIV